MKTENTKITIKEKPSIKNKETVQKRGRKIFSKKTEPKYVNMRDPTHNTFIHTYTQT